MTMTDEDGLRIEAAEQYGFREIDNDRGDDFYVCTESQLLAFAKACERAGRAQAIKIATEKGIGSREFLRMASETAGKL